MYLKSFLNFKNFILSDENYDELSCYMIDRISKSSLLAKAFGKCIDADEDIDYDFFDEINNMSHAAKLFRKIIPIRVHASVKDTMKKISESILGSLGGLCRRKQNEAETLVRRNVKIKELELELLKAQKNR